MRVDLTVNFAGQKITVSAEVPDELLANVSDRQHFSDVIRCRIEERMKEEFTRSFVEGSAVPPA